MLLKFWRRINASLSSLFLVILLYALATVIMTYPVAFKMSSVVAGFDRDDSFQYVWALWWAKKAIVDLHTSPANLSYNYHPSGAYHPMLSVTPYDELVSTPLQLLFGPVVTYNTQILLSLPLAGVTAYLLCYYLTGNRLASFLGGLIFAFFPNKSYHAMEGHFLQSMIYWFPLYALFLIRLLRKPSIRNALLCGVFLTFSLLVYIMHIAYFVIPFTLIFVLYHYWADREKLVDVRFMRGFGISLGMAAVVTGPFFFPFIIHKLSGQLRYFEMVGTVRYSADLLSFFIPSPYHPLLTKIEPFHTVLTRYLDSTRGMVFVGFVSLLLAFLGSLRNRQTQFWLILAFCGAILCLGPFFKVGGRLVEYSVEDYRSYVVLPYAIIKKLPFFEWGRMPARMDVTTMFAVAVLVAYGSRAALKRPEGVKAKAVLATALASVILFEYVVTFPFPVGGSVVSEFFKQLAGEAGDYAILSLPLWPRTASNMAMYHQTIHKHKIVGGFIHRLPPEAEPMMRLVEQLVDPALNTDDIIEYPGAIDRPRNLNRYDIKYVVLYKRVLTLEDRSAIVSLLSRSLGEPVYEDAQISAFAVPEASSEGTEEGLLVMLGPTWHSIESLEGVPSRWMINDGLLYVDTPLEGKYRLKFAALPFRDSRHLQVFVNDELIEEYEADNFLRSYATKAFSLKQGWNVVEFHVPEGCERPSEVFEDAGDNRCLSLLFQEIRFLSAKADSIQHPLAIDLNGEILLLGYDLKDDLLHPGEELHLTLYWQAQRDIEEDYTVFVHLVDGQGRVVAQRDAQPLEGAYPTSRWGEHEMVRDEHVLAIPLEVPPGEYQLKVGMYLLSTMERLWVVGDASGENSITLGKMRVGDE